MALQVVDRAMQSFGAEGLSQDTPLAYWWANLRTLRLADVRCLRFCMWLGCLLLTGVFLAFRTPFQGPDEVHIQQIGQRELKRVPWIKELSGKAKSKEQALFLELGIKPLL